MTTKAKELVNGESHAESCGARVHCIGNGREFYPTY
jgi:hypothetical protein